MDPDALTDSPVLIWASIIIGVLVVIATGVPRVLGPIGKAIDEWQTRRRAARAAADDADIAEKDRQIGSLERDLEKKDREHGDFRRRVAARETRWRIEKRAHDAWDYQVTRDLTGRGIDHPIAPEYMTPDPPCPKENTP